MEPTMHFLITRSFRMAARFACGSVLTAAALAAPDVGHEIKLPTPAERQIEAAEQRREPVQLAIGLTRRARETGDPQYYDRALQVLGDILKADPDRADAVRVLAWVRMGRHEFGEARRIARDYLVRHPEDPIVWGVLGDAAMELGLYHEAGTALQAMNDRRPGPAAYSRAAYFEELRGQLPDALELMQRSLQATAPNEFEDRAWLLVQVGHLHDLSGDPEGAEASYQTALEIFPGYHYALAALAELYLKTGRAEQAVARAQQSIEAAPHAERYLILADALRGAGHEARARAAEERFEALALQDTEKADNENHDLVLFYLERRPDPRRALAIARREAHRRRDIHTLDRLALALLKNGRPRAAIRLETEVLESGTRDPLIARHAAEIREGGTSPKRP